MHPQVRILCLLVIATGVPWLPPVALLPLAGTLAAWGIFRPLTGHAMLRGLRRVRWLLLSLIVLFAGFTPGEPLIAELGAASPTQAGLMLAAHRAGVLAAMVMFATGALHAVSPPVLAAALRGLLQPLGSEVALRFATRVGLLLAEMPSAEQRVRENLRVSEGGISERAAALFSDIETRQNGAVTDNALQTLAPVPPVQWSLPVLLLLVCLALSLSGV